MKMNKPRKCFICGCDENISEGSCASDGSGWVDASDFVFLKQNKKMGCKLNN
jgi:hypothetical protein